MLRLWFSGLVVAGVMVLATVIMAYQAIDIKMNYQLAPGRITAVTKDCFIKKRKDRIVEKGTSDLAYMPCSDAPGAAKEFGFSPSDIHTRSMIKYAYMSPADGRRHTGSYERTDAAADIVRGKNITVYAHNQLPDDSRTTKSNFFLDDTGE
jgi:hypothetical protein